MLSFSDGISRIVSESTTLTLSEISSNMKFSVENEIDEKINLLQSISDALIVIGYNQDGIRDYIDIIETHDSFGINNIAILGSNGIGIDANNEFIDISNEEYFHEVSLGNNVITDLTVSPVDGNECVIIALPIYVDGKFDGVIQGEFSLPEFSRTLRTSFDGAGYAFIVDSKGEMITENDNINSLTQDNLFLALNSANFHGDIDTDKIMDDLEKRGVVTVSYSIDGYTRVAQIRSILNTNWYFFIAIPDTVLLKDANAINEDLSLLILEISTLVIFVAGVIVLLQVRWSRNIKHALEYDELTGAYNLVKFKKEIYNILIENPNHEFTIVKLDMINFKAINEIYGFETGNKVIKALVDVGRDTKIPFFTQARVGADELLLFARADFFSNLEESSIYYEDVFKKALNTINQHDFKFRYGRYEIVKNEVDVDNIVNKVTMAHYFAKSKSGTCIVDYDDSFKRSVLKATELANKMHPAMDNKEFKMYLQPKINIKKNKVCAAEALVRWQESDGVMIYPNDFIPVFENNGFIVELDFYMLERVCEYLNNRISNNQIVVPISVNFSRLHLYKDDTIKKITEIIDKNKVPRKLIEIELTESASVDVEDKVALFQQELHNNDIKISLDDFGAGYSSYETLQKIEFDAIKIDRSFMIQLEENDKRKLVVRTIVEMINNMGMTSVTEGVETKEQLALLKEANCDIAQGYLFAKALPEDEFNDFLLK